jgi:hypothetical protein
MPSNGRAIAVSPVVVWLAPPYRDQAQPLARPPRIEWRAAVEVDDHTPQAEFRHLDRVGALAVMSSVSFTLELPGGASGWVERSETHHRP